ncbi:hypothetical protein EG329_005838 [Mollisiaceae sp. DMI_Dod_QoI]|nr:hypothetical protein EG329_005838 [Helotiales sp. DMI_Dod_QoI]
MASHPSKQVYLARRAIQADTSWILDLQNRVQEALRQSGSLQELSLGSAAILEARIEGGEVWVFEIEVLVDGVETAQNGTEERTPVGAVIISRFGDEGCGDWRWLEGPESSHVLGRVDGYLNQEKVKKDVNGSGENRIWYLHSLMLAPELQGQGLGRAFLRQVLNILEVEMKIGDKGKEEVKGGIIFLDCWAGNDKLRGFYEAIGFKSWGSFPEKDYEIAVFAWETG